MGNSYHEAGIYPDTRHGQNFLIDLNLLDLLLRAAEITADDVDTNFQLGCALARVGRD